eukprot:gene8661-6087_t
MEANPNSVLETHKKWYLVQLPVKSCSLKDIANANVDKEKLDEYYQEAQAVLEDEKALSQLDRSRWFSSQFLTRGTQADKVASAAVKLADTDFMFFLDGFNLLFDTARADTHHYEAALKALTVVWPKLLPPRPLKRFVAQYFPTLPEEGTKERKKVLVYWYLEDYIKRVYGQFLALSEAMLKDRVQQRREAWLEAVGKLVCTVAEGRTTVMAILIGKLGDPTSQVAHKAYHHILHLLSESSMHQSALFTELEKIIFTKNCPVRTMRYAVNIMNQLVFSKDERKLALKSVQTYLSLFRQLAKTQQLDSSVTTAIMVGLRRAYPYAGTDLSSIETHINALFIISHTGNFQQRVATLSLLQLITSNKGASPAFQTRWYRALYDLLLLSPHKLPQASQLTSFFSMLHKAMRADKDQERVAAFVHRLLQRALFFHDAMVCAVLLLVGEMAQASPLVRELITGKKTHDTGDEKPYDPKHRDPQFSRASKECLWTLNLLSRHAHPSVVKLAVLLLFNEEIVFDVHPLDDMTMLNFLDMLVDASGTGKAVAKASDAGEKTNTGISVFRRASHAATVPSASDPYFIKAKPSEVDVSALFLHRYAVQRQRFLDGLAQTQSTWGDASGEADVALRVANLDTSLFGPDGALGAQEQQQEEEAANSRSATPISDDELVPSSGEDDALDWGGGDSDLDAADELDELDEDEDIGDGPSDDDDALGGTTAQRGGLDDGEEFGELMERHKKERSKKRKREDDWLDSRTHDPARPRKEFRAGQRGLVKKFATPQRKQAGNRLYCTFCGTLISSINTLKHFEKKQKKKNDNVNDVPLLHGRNTPVGPRDSYTSSSLHDSLLPLLISADHACASQVLEKRLLGYSPLALPSPHRPTPLEKLMTLYRSLCIRHDEVGIEIVLNDILALLIHSHQFEQAESLIVSSDLKLPHRANNQAARYYYYVGLTRAMRLDYVDANQCLQQALRKAPERALGFRIAATKLAVVVQLLLGEIPPRSDFLTKMMRDSLVPYLQLTSCVRFGQLGRFMSIVEQHTDTFKHDRTYSLILRIRQHVIKTGLRRICQAYSRITIKDVCVKLSMDNPADAEYILAKAIRDGVIDAVLDNEKGELITSETVDVYSTSEPLQALQRRIQFLNSAHNDVMRAMRYEETDPEVAAQRKQAEREEMERVFEGDIDELDYEEGL